MFPFWIELTLAGLDQWFGLLAAIGAGVVNVFAGVR
jgi:hypothetical protein